MTERIRIAVVGAGTMAQSVHLPVLRRRWDLYEIAALADISERRRREAGDVFGIPQDRRYEDLAGILDAVRARELSIDAIVLASDGLHSEDVLSAMRRGIPMLVEPPLGYAREDIERVRNFERMCGRPLLMLAYPNQYDEALAALADALPVTDARMVEAETIMPASTPLFRQHNVTPSAYDLPLEVRNQRREALDDAVEKGAGRATTARDRDIFVKGLLTGLMHQLAALRTAYGPLEEVRWVRQWPDGVIPGSIEILATLRADTPLRAVWHYLPFAPEHSDTISVLSTRRRVRADLRAPSLGDRPSRLISREKDGTAGVQEIVREFPTPCADMMWDAFHDMVTHGKAPHTGSAEALADIELARQILAEIVTAEGRTLEPEPEPVPEAAAEGSSESGSESEPESGSVSEADLQAQSDEVSQADFETGAGARSSSEDAHRFEVGSSPENESHPGAGELADTSAHGQADAHPAAETHRRDTP
ncbi:Gfo/Idh/MocA family oxidoreductase [Devriesea agamarum]|uniref:Gfo/Idh/MocA family oxidoreductase n=1 Tax=Devriesea agamarum TaxID=472569 RepID=UPI00071E0494|nr:Gfo/Idh/MocA family oxidoreductase [Devriesea agamarum]